MTSLSTIRLEQAEEAFQKVLDIMELDVADEHIKRTANRFIRYLDEFNGGTSLTETLGTPFNSSGDQMIVQTRIPFRAICAHHLLPFVGTVSIGYIPDELIVGLSKLARLSRAAGLNAPSIQEKITHDIADTLMQVLSPEGLIVIIDAMHTCMAVRGIAAPGVYTTTSVVRGKLRDNEPARQEFFELCKQNSLR